MPHNVFIASSVKAIAENLLNICNNFDLNVVILQDPENLSKELKESKFDLIFVDYNLVDLINNDLIALHAELNNTYIVIYGPNNIRGQTQKNGFKIDSFLKVPISPIDVKDIFKRYFRLPGHVVLITRNAESEFITTLRAIGYRLTIVLTSEKLISSINATVPDLIITEFDTGGQDGAELCKEIKGIEPINKIPLLIACENRDVDIIEKLIISNPDDVILSPYNSPNNLKKIQDYLPLPTNGRKLKALVVDDSGTIRNVISGMFMELGYEVKTAINGFEGFKAVQKFNPDIITSDYDMPVLNGWEFCTEIRDDDRFKDIPIIMITTRATDLDKKKGALLGVSAYLTKPFETKKPESVFQPKKTLSPKIKKIIDDWSVKKIIVPAWFANNNMNWVLQGKITEQEFLAAYTNLVNTGAITFTTPEISVIPIPEITFPSIPEVSAVMELTTTNFQVKLNNKIQFSSSLSNADYKRLQDEMSLEPKITLVFLNQTDFNPLSNFSKILRQIQNLLRDQVVETITISPTGQVITAPQPTVAPGKGLMGAGVLGIIGILMLGGFIADHVRKRK